MSAKKALKKCLQSLSSDEFNAFISELLDREGEPRVYKNQVEGKGVIEVTNVMVNVFSERNVLSVAVEVLREANLGGFADQLAASAPVSAPVPAPVASGPAPSNPAPSPGGSLSAKEFVEKYKMELIKRLTDTDPLFDLLLHHKVLSGHSYSEFKALPTDRGRMSKLLMGPYLKSKATCEIFYNFLKEEQPFLIDELLEN
ncbi:apoptosis-associated speck-like protein containing a CARD [Oryzias latipes]|uniref:CARD domain-containing protein n=1 Tax=Oryzias latipes TaxID=8090 RepID=A0A3B3HBS0_ORYLA|nr:apoptosis-associated speck-like protein containing a CARD [Oryzias latipes]